MNETHPQYLAVFIEEDGDHCQEEGKVFNTKRACMCWLVQKRRSAASDHGRWEIIGPNDKMVGTGRWSKPRTDRTFQRFDEPQQLAS